MQYAANFFSTLANTISGQSNLTKDWKIASPPQTDGSIVFSRWCQCALPSGHIGATWRIWLNFWTHADFGPLESTTQMANWLVQPFLHSSRQKVSILYNRQPFPQKLPLPTGGSGPHLTWFLGPIRAHNPNGILIGSAVFAGLTSVSDRPTDHATRSVTIDLILQHLAYSMFTSAPQIRVTILALYTLVCMYVCMYIVRAMRSKN